MIKVGLYLWNPATKQAVDIAEIEEGGLEVVDTLLKDAIGKGIRSAAEILGVDPMQIMTSPQTNGFVLRLKMIPGIHDPCGKPWGECTCGTPGERKLPQ